MLLRWVGTWPDHDQWYPYSIVFLQGSWRRREIRHHDHVRGSKVHSWRDSIKKKRKVKIWQKWNMLYYSIYANCSSTISWSFRRGLLSGLFLLVPETLPDEKKLFLVVAINTIREDLQKVLNRKQLQDEVSRWKYLKDQRITDDEWSSIRLMAWNQDFYANNFGVLLGTIIAVLRDKITRVISPQDQILP